MSTPPIDLTTAAPGLPAAEIPPSKLRALKLSVVLSMILVCFHLAETFLGPPHAFLGVGHGVHTLAAHSLKSARQADVLLLLPYVAVLLALGTRRIKAGLVLGAACGTGLGSIIFLLGMPGFNFESGFSYLVVLFGLLLAQAVLVASAAAAFFKQRRGVWDAAQLAATTLGSFLYFGYVLLTAAYVDGHVRVRHYGAAMGSMYMINTAEITYAATHKTGFSPSLDALEGLNELARGRKRDYTFMYTPGPKDAAGRIRSYTVIARPVKYGELGVVRSFSIDESRVIHFTDEDRAANPKDPSYPTYDQIMKPIQ